MNTLTPQDCYQIINELMLETTGRKDMVAVDTSSFVSVGETILRTGTENTLNALSTVLGRTIFSTRPYEAKFGVVSQDSDRWGAMTRKVIYLPMETEQSQDWNTNLASTQLANGNSVDMFKINAPRAIQLNFYGTKVLQMHITRFRDQLSLAFQNEREFALFIDGVMTEFYNDVETKNEAERRATVLNFMAGISSMGLTEVDLTAEYNAKFGTTYTRQQLLTTYLDSFLKFFVSVIKTYSKNMTERTALYHANLTIDGTTKEILHHTPKSYQRMLMYAPLFTDAEASVYPTIFNTQYLNIGDYEEVNFWQDPKNPSAINITPNILDTSTGESKTAETPISLDYVVGLLFDRDALGVVNQFEYSSVTPFNSAGGYYNMFLHWRKNYWNDFTENAVLFVMGEGV